METIVPRAIPLSSTAPTLTAAPLIPEINTTEVRIKLRDFVKSTFFSISIRMPAAAITPKSRMQTPPMTGTGMLLMMAANLPMNEIAMAMQAAPPITHTLKTFVIAITPIFSPYVVLGVAPTKPDNTLEMPSPSRERSNPGSLTRSFSTIFPVTTKWPICSASTTKAAGMIIIMALTLKVGA